MIFGSIIKKLVPGGLKKKLFDMAVDGGMKRLATWLKGLFTSKPSSADLPTLRPFTTKDKQKPKTKRPRF
jgi:hypothetical protein